jgi:hypothetical protein
MAEVREKKAWYKRWWAITLFIIFGMGILGNIFGGNDSSTDSNSNLQTTTPEQIPAKQKDDLQTTTPEQITGKVTASQQEVKTYSLGDEIQAGDFKWKITKSSTAREIGQDIMGTFFGEKADGIFIIVDVEVKNTGKSAKYLMDSYLKLIDDQGREFSPNSAAAIYLKPEGSALMFEQVNPGITKKGKIVFDVPEGLKVANIRISSNLLQSSFYNVKLMV